MDTTSEPAPGSDMAKAPTWVPAEHLSDVQVGSTRWQSYFEFLAVLLVLMTWARPNECLCILGDNSSSLTNAVQIKGKRSMARVARELAWRKAREGWRYVVGHLPTEVNSVADALSRLAEPTPAPLPPGLSRVPRIQAPAVRDLWRIPILE